jgi:methanogenic corrinoid protein MtbC1/DNA-binding XRE family transcriptional regulator
MAATLEKYGADASAEFFDARQQRFAQAIVTGDHESAEQVTGELISAQQTLGDIYLKVVTPALAGVGESWCRGDIGVGEQKLATEIVIGQMDRLRSLFTPPARRSLYRVMVACIEGEQHFIGARMTADLCGARSWSVDFLGPNVPNEALVEMVHRRHPQVLALSVTMAQGVEHVRWVVGELAKSAPEVRVVIGGLAIVDNASVKNLSQRCELAKDIITGFGLIGRLLRADQPKSVLKEYQMVLARRVRDLRTKRGWTQEHLAEVTQVARACIIAVEGAKQNVSMDILVRMANALEVPPETLLSAEG